MMTGESMFTLEETAARLRMSKKTLLKHVAEGTCRYLNIGTQRRRIMRFTPYMIDRFLEKLKRKDAPQCQSTSLKTPLITTPGSSSKVIAFTALQKPNQKKKLS